MDCQVCGKAAQITIGGVALCAPHAEDVNAEIEIQRAGGKNMINAAGIARQFYRELHGASNYLMRDIPADLMANLKIRAARDGSTIREILIDAAKKYLEA